MAEGDKYFDCDRNTEITWKEIIAAVMRRDASDNYYIMYVANTPACDTLTDVPECNWGALDIEALVAKAVVLDCNGYPALNLAACTCD